jgi:hypothetical protein
VRSLSFGLEGCLHPFPIAIINTQGGQYIKKEVCLAHSCGG